MIFGFFICGTTFFGKKWGKGGGRTPPRGGGGGKVSRLRPLPRLALFYSLRSASPTALLCLTYLTHFTYSALPPAALLCLTRLTHFTIHLPTAHLRSVIFFDMLVTFLPRIIKITTHKSPELHRRYTHLRSLSTPSKCATTAYHTYIPVTSPTYPRPSPYTFRCHHNIPLETLRLAPAHTNHLQPPVARLSYHTPTSTLLQKFLFTALPFPQPRGTFL